MVSMGASLSKLQAQIACSIYIRVAGCIAYAERDECLHVLSAGKDFISQFE